MEARALIVVDVQKAFDDAGFWGRRNNPECEQNVAALIDAWRHADQPLVYVQHHSREAGSPLRPEAPGSGFKDVVSGEPDLLVTKHVHSAFHGDPDLAAWLRSRGAEGIVVCGIQTNICCETTARVGSDLGFEVSFAIDATHTFDQDDGDGGTVRADELARATRSNLAAEFARVTDAREAIDELAQSTSAS